MERSRLRTGTIIIVIALLCLFIGFQLGTYVTIKAIADIGSRFVDAELIERAIYQYKNNIGSCFPEWNITNIS